ncbi:MAG: tRNA (adenosine(37)-N6)-threonylcarbamoyltransferase complex ATPase subunit type 1 TsaE [Nitrospirae bacterium]|nr:MAG: tRNA (adenosine(37)-N6)-threonylcarbamoyltransferase complex ATPase subunit type 1 TsaE [Nitrospirota bacterium]
MSELYEWRTLLRSSTDTEQLGRFIGQSLRGGEVLALYGELGTGKTTLVRGIAAGLEVPSHLVNSPTFVLIHEYQGRVPLAHVDLYRIEAQPELQHIGLSDYLDGQTVVAIEWADKGGVSEPPERPHQENYPEGQGNSDARPVGSRAEATRGLECCE